MGVGIRHYLFPDGGEPKRLSQRLVKGLIFGDDAIPEYAQSRQRVMTVYLNTDEEQPQAAFRTECSVWAFDEDGKIRAGLLDALREGMNAVPTPFTTNNGTVVDMLPRLSKKRLAEKYRWEATQADIDRVAADIWPKDASSRLKPAKGTSPRQPALTFDAKQALSAASDGFWTIHRAIDGLKEPGLKGFAFEARRRADADRDSGFLYCAIADMADRRLEILRRKRTGKGIWYASVDVIKWNDGIGESLASFHKQCDGKDAAEIAARSFLAEHADKFADGVTVEAQVLTDLEWTN